MLDLAWALTQDLGLLALASISFAFFRLALEHRPALLRALLGALLFGGLSILVMATPSLTWKPGMFLDLRIVPILVAASYFGRPAAAFAVLIAIAYRLWMGGAGAIPGSLTIVVAGVAGHAASYLVPYSKERLWVMLGGAMLAPLTFLSAPEVSYVNDFANAVGPLAAFNVMGCVVLDTFLRRETRRMDLLSQLWEEAKTDPLTGLLNRRAFDQQMDLLSAQPSTGALLLVDVDNLKTLNDRYGHAGGDRALSSVAKVLHKAVDKSGLVARIGGDEFAVVMPAASEDRSKQIAERIRSMLVCVSPVDNTAAVTVSIGGAIWSGSTTRMHVTPAADQALYEAKMQGRNRSVFVNLDATPLPVINKPVKRSNASVQSHRTVELVDQTQTAISSCNHVLLRARLSAVEAGTVHSRPAREPIVINTSQESPRVKNKSS